MGTGLPLLALSHFGAENPVDISLSPVQHGLLTFTVVFLQPRETAARTRSQSADA